ncbi:MAG: hypothetical protein E7403_04330 [Ruminococcaceae bacterium]|nr:hypothetical protein [Oscillospiraceae bacterium]
MYNIVDFGAVSDGKTNVTSAVQRAVDACREQGGVVYVPFGTYVVASVHIYSHVHFVFEPGAVFLGSTDADDFDDRETVDYPLYQDFSHSFFHRAMFWGEDCEDISFSGNGTIDMQSTWENRDIPGENAWCCRRAAKIFSFKNCKDVAISELKLYNATDLAVYLAGCENVRLTGLTVKVHIDGISPDCCKNVIISDCHVVAGDDAIVPKCSYTLNKKQLCENVVISNCTVSSRMCAIKLGTETNGGFKNIVIQNCAIYDTCLTGVALEIADGGEMDGITVSNITMKNVGSPFIIQLTDRGRGPEGTTIGSIKNVLMDNIVAIGPYDEIEPIRYKVDSVDETLFDKAHVIASSVIGQPNGKIENISLSNIYLTVPGGGTEKDREIIVPEREKMTPSAATFGEVLPAYGIYFRHIKNLNLCNVQTFTLSEDAREAMVFEDVE